MSDVIGIIGAMESEVKTLAASLKNSKTVVINKLTFYTGTLNDKDVVVVQSGIGKVNAGMCAQLLVFKFNATKIINTGIAGATGSGLHIFDFVISEKAVYHDFDTTAFGYKLGQVPGLPEAFTADNSLIAAAEKAFPNTDFADKYQLKKGLIASGDQFISAGERKDFIKTNFNPLCVEMEGAAIAHACTINNTPFLIVRCMSDMADETVESTYSFNEDECARMSAEFVQEILKNI